MRKLRAQICEVLWKEKLNLVNKSWDGLDQCEEAVWMCQSTNSQDALKTAFPHCDGPKRENADTEREYAGKEGGTGSDVVDKDHISADLRAVAGNGDEKDAKTTWLKGERGEAVYEDVRKTGAVCCCS